MDPKDLRLRRKSRVGSGSWEGDNGRGKEDS